MKGLGYLLITFGVLGGSFLAVEQVKGVSWPGYLLMFAIGAAGVALARTAVSRESRAEETIATNISAISSSLERVVEKIHELDRDKETIDIYELRHVIDKQFPDDLDEFVQAR